MNAPANTAPAPDPHLPAARIIAARRFRLPLVRAAVVSALFDDWDMVQVARAGIDHGLKMRGRA